MLVETDNDSIMSQFHYGSIDTEPSYKINVIASESQFHYGSIDTVEHKKALQKESQVSIPLWFD